MGKSRPASIAGQYHSLMTATLPMLTGMDWVFSAAHQTQRSAPGSARGRRQYREYGKAVQRRQEGFVGGFYAR